MITPESIQAIQQALAVEQLNKLDVVANTQRAVAFAPDNFSKHDLEAYMPGRARERGTYQTTLISAFCDYVNDMSNQHEKLTQCFVDEQNFKATAILNFRVDPQEHPYVHQGHCDYLAIIKLRQTAAYQKLLAMVDRKMSQQEAAEFMEDYGYCIAAFAADGTDIRLSKVVSTLRSLKIEAKRDSEHKVESFNQSRSLMESIEAKGEALPHTLTYTCEPYYGLQARDVRLRLSVIAGETPAFVLRIIQLEEMEEEMAQEFHEKLDSVIDPALCDVRLGEFYTK